MVSGELVKMLVREARNLVGDELGASDREGFESDIWLDARLQLPEAVVDAALKVDGKRAMPRDLQGGWAT